MVQGQEPPKYKSPTSVGKRQTIPVDVNDRRAKKNNPNNPRGRSGAEFEIIDLTGSASLIEGGDGSGTAVANGGSGNNGGTPDVIIPGSGGNPPVYYPGGSGPYVIGLTDPSDISAVWNGDELDITFTWDIGNAANGTASQFVVDLTSDGITQSTPFDTFSPISAYSVGTNQFMLPISKQLNEQMFGIFTTNITKVCIEVADPLANTNVSGAVCTTNVGSHIFDVNPPTILVTSINNGYNVSYGESAGTPKGSTVYKAGTSLGVTPVGIDSIDVWEIESNSSVAPTITLDSSNNPTGWSRTYLGLFNPVNVISPDLNSRWVAARFNSSSAEHTDFCAPQFVTPTAPVSINTTKPTDPTVTAAWSGNDIVLSYTLPSSNAGSSFIVRLTAPNNQVGFFYFTLTGTVTTGTFTITSTDLLNQFGLPVPSTFDIFFQSVSGVGIKSDGITVNWTGSSTRTTGLSTQIPSPTFTAIIDGVVGTFDFSQYNASYGEVYMSYEDCWTPLSTSTSTHYSFDIIDYFNAQYVSGGAVGTNTITLNNFINEDGVFTDPTVYLGVPFHGTGVPDYTFISAISLVSTGTYQLTLSTYNLTTNSNVASNFTTQASGQYTMQMLAYSGSSPATIYNTLYAPLYFTVRYVDQFGTESYFCPTKSKTPLNITTSLINTAISVTKGAGAIYLGDTATSLPNVIIGTSNNESGIFVWGPNSVQGTQGTQYTTLNTQPTTSIIGDTASPYTFITTDAKIADWSITAQHIQNDLTGGSYSTGYVGLSGSNSNYSFWAGASASDNSAQDAKFSVTPAGLVTAKNIQIVGGNLDIGASSYKYSAQGTTSSSTLTVNTTNLSSGMYVVGTGIPDGTIINSVGSGSIVLSNNPTSNITNGLITFISPNGAHITTAGQLFATDAYINGNITATGGKFTGNVQLVGGSLYALGAQGTTNSGIRTIFNAQGIAAYNAGGGYAELLTTPLADGSVFATTAANIGGWSVSTQQIYKTSRSGKGNIVLDSQNGYIYVSDTNVSQFTAGINSVIDTNGVAFWAGTASLAVQSTQSTQGLQTSLPVIADPALQSPSYSSYLQSHNGSLPQDAFGNLIMSPYSNPFIVRNDGTLFARGGNFFGNVMSSGSLGTITMDSRNDMLVFDTNPVASQEVNGYDATQRVYSFLVPRNNNIYLISPGPELPWGSAHVNPKEGYVGTQNTHGVITGPPTSKPYFSAGSSFYNSWGFQADGIGMYTGEWDYFNNAQHTSKPFITVTSGLLDPTSQSSGGISGTNFENSQLDGSGVQISGSPDLGMLFESTQHWTGDFNSIPRGGILIYTSQEDPTQSDSIHPSYSPSTKYGPYVEILRDMDPNSPTIPVSTGLLVGAGVYNPGDVVTSARIQIGVGSAQDVNNTSTQGIYSPPYIELIKDINYSSLGYQSNTGKITLFAATNAYMQIADGNSTLYGQGGDRPLAYQGGSRIDLYAENNGVNIYGLPIQKDVDIRAWPSDGSSIVPLQYTTYFETAQHNATIEYATPTSLVYPDLSIDNKAHYRNAYPLGNYARQRLLVEDPVTGMAMLGMAVYYRDTSDPIVIAEGIDTPSTSSGYVGDLWIDY